MLCSPSAFGERRLTVAEHFVLFWGLSFVFDELCSVSVLENNDHNIDDAEKTKTNAAKTMQNDPKRSKNDPKALRK